MRGPGNMQALQQDLSEMEARVPAEMQARARGKGEIMVRSTAAERAGSGDKTCGICH